jgi:hypothetical protein
MFESEEFVVFLAKVVEAKVHRSAIGSRSQHHIDHYLGHPYLLLFRELFFLGRLAVITSLSSLSDPSLFLVIVSRYSILSPKLLPGLF